ncbi:MAG: hypothetical protein ACM3S2_07600 [Ignavibacteriales bacterium]
MKLAIVEVMPFGHFTLVESITEIFASDDKNEIYIFINAAGEKVLAPVFKDKKNVRIVTQKENESLSSFFLRINTFSPDKIYITTLEKWFRDFYLFKFTGQINLIIHNIDDWSRFGLFLGLSNFLYEGFRSNIIYNFKRYLIYPYWRKRILENVLSSGGKLVVLSRSLKKELSRFVPDERLEVIPFSVFNESTADYSGSNKYLRISIPGKVSSVRRDYDSVFSSLEGELEFFKDKIELVLLGGVSLNEGGGPVIQRADELISRGLRIKYFKQDFIPFDEFEAEFAKSDIVIGNMKVVLDKLSSVYGKTKETGFSFTMIRFAKPGICIAGYNLMDELKSSVLFYGNPGQLKDILKKILSDKNLLTGLKKEARKNSLLFTPESIYKQLTSSTTDPGATGQDTALPDK